MFYAHAVGVEVLRERVHLLDVLEAFVADSCARQPRVEVAVIRNGLFEGFREESGRGEKFSRES